MFYYSFACNENYKLQFGKAFDYGYLHIEYCTYFNAIKKENKTNIVLNKEKIIPPSKKIKRPQPPLKKKINN